jgi:ABC-type molybdate transport system substrate-binding protein
MVGAKPLPYVVVAALLPILFGCGGSGSAEGGEESALTVYAASSLTDAFGELKTNFEEENPGSDLRERVETIEIPEELNVVASYPIAVIEDAQSPELAQGWVDLVLSDDGQRIMEEWGFERAG